MKMNKQKLTKEEVLVIDKIMHEAKITNYFKLRITKTGRQYFWNGEDSERLNIRDGLQYICNTILYGFDFAFEFGLTQQEIDTWNAMIDRFGLSDEFKAENFKEREILHKESYGLDDIFEPEFDIGDRVWFHDDEGESNWFIVTNVYDDDRYDLESEDGEVVVQDVDGSKLSSSPVDGEMFHESTNVELVNNEESGSRLYEIGLWWGSGYTLDMYRAYAFSEEEALNYVVAYIEKTHPKWLESSDECAHDMMKEYDEESPEFQETFMYVDATSEGADEPHYIWSENLRIKELNSVRESIKDGFKTNKEVTKKVDELIQAIWKDAKNENKLEAFHIFEEKLSNAISEYWG